MLQIEFKSEDQTLGNYSSLLEQFTKFELQMGIETVEEKTQFLFKLFLNSRNVRQGPQPGIEQQANILKVIRTYVQKNEPIPVLIPSGPKKTKHLESIDLAELSMIKILICLNKTAQTVYKPGFVFHVRMEDNTGHWLEGQTKEITQSMDDYIRDFYILVTHVFETKYIIPFRESKLAKYENYVVKAKENTAVIFKYLLATPFGKIPADDLPEYLKLKEIGWQGTIPLEMRTYLEDKYRKLYPKASLEYILNMMAKYLGGTLARHQIKAVGKEQFTDGCLEIGFANPTPGVPESLLSTRIYYRTMTLSNTKRHMPYWRAKGIFKIDENDKIRMSLINWSDLDEINLIEGYLTFTNYEWSVKVKADCLI